MTIPLFRLIPIVVIAFACTVGGAERRAVPTDVQAVMNKYCVSCHGTDKQKGKVRLDTLASLAGDARTDLLNTMHESIRFEEMPPEDEKQPTDAERKLLDDWIARALGATGTGTLEDKLKKPEYGNRVDHESLFSGEHADLPGFTHDRRWLISEYIFDAKIQRILGDGPRQRVYGGHRISGLGLANPFLLPERSGVRYYANTDLTGGHLSTMLSNAHKASNHITERLVKDRRRKSYLPAVRQVLSLEDEHEATLASRRAFLEKHIARVCDDIYGDKNGSLLPEFVPVVLNEIKELAEGETYKRLPWPVANGQLTRQGGADAFREAVLDPANADKTDRQIADICERVWFYFGDHERDIQGRLSILREYTPELREHLTSNKKIKRDEYKPLDDAEMETVAAAILRYREKGDRYRTVIEKCVAEWERGFKQQRIDAGPPSDELFAAMIDELFVLILERSPGSAEADEYLALVKRYTEQLGRRKAVQKFIQTLLLTSEFAYRSEFGSGEPDEHGRHMLSPRDASYAIAYALTDQSPDAALIETAESGRLNTREDYRREVVRILSQRDRTYVIDKKLADRWRSDNTTQMPIRELRFFREFFGYPKALTIFKDEKRFGGDRLGSATNRLLAEADRIVAHILEEDQGVFEKLLTTEEFFVFHDGDSERMQAASDHIKRIYEYFKDTDWPNFTIEDLAEHADFLREAKIPRIDPDHLDGKDRYGPKIWLFKVAMTTITARLDKGQKEAAPFDYFRAYGSNFMPGENVARFFNYEFDNWDYDIVQPARVPNRRGMLTHPAWLIAHAQNTETDPVIRGKWVREKLLAGTIPDVPITVDAVIPEDHNRTLRDRLAGATENQYCWRCHKQMNPLGYAFEMYDDFGRFRDREPLEYPEHLTEKGPEQNRNTLVDTRDRFKTLPVDPTGYLEGTGDRALDGAVTDAIDLAERLGKSRRVRQSIIRHAFRYFVGRNERLSDSKALIDAERAYVESDGSFDAVIVSLLTSDSFIYRKAIED